MSTYLYLECACHVPPLRAEDESGQHLYDLPRIRDEIANRARLIEEYDSSELDYFERNSARFLTDHRHCVVTIRDEYGRAHPTEVTA